MRFQMKSPCWKSCTKNLRRLWCFVFWHGPYKRTGHTFQSLKPLFRCVIVPYAVLCTSADAATCRHQHISHVRGPGTRGLYGRAFQMWDLSQGSDMRENCWWRSRPRRIKDHRSSASQTDSLMAFLPQRFVFLVFKDPLLLVTGEL